MDNLNMVIMGKTGAGKSTLLNAILGEKLAPTGKGQAVTKENKIYSKKMMLPLGTDNDGFYGLVSKNVNLYDTVGLEVDQKITNSTLEDLQRLITEAKKTEKTRDITTVLFCVNYRSSRFESYELELIKKLSIEYEIPFVLALTQCIDDEEGELERQIKKDLPELKIVRVLAENYRTKGGVIEAYGITELLRESILNYDICKIRILEEKLNKLDADRKRRIELLEKEAKSCVEKYTGKAEKIGWIPVGCIPVIHGMCIKMLSDLNKIVGIRGKSGFADEMFAEVVLGVVITPFMAVPVVSAGVASAYVDSVGNAYVDALLRAIEKSSDNDLVDNELMAKRIKEELHKRKS